VSGERRVLHDVGGVLADIVDGLHDVSRQLDGLPYALVGGVAVLVHVQGHRVTQDIDSAVRAVAVDVRQRLQLVADAELTKDSDADIVLPNGVPVDVLTAGQDPPRRGIGARREAKAHAVRWAVETAVTTTIDVDPSGRLGPLALPVATRAALVAMKSVSTADPARGQKRGSDLLDVWRLLSDNPVRTAELLAQLREAPDRLMLFTRQRLHDLFGAEPGEFVRDMARGSGSAADVAEVRELYDELIRPELGDQ
jgi:hypothetical protein